MRPAYCDNCNAFFGLINPPVITITEGVEIHACTIGCPKCGKMAQTSFDVVRIGGEVARIINTDSDPKAKWSVLSKLLERAKMQNLPHSTMITRVAEISPELAEVLKPFVNSKAPVWGLIIAFVIFALTRCSMSVNVDVNDLFEEYMKSQGKEIKPFKEQHRNKSTNGAAHDAKPEK